ncbi:MAG: DUF3500 domain-containing protein [Pseudomonadota bacterium]
MPSTTMKLMFGFVGVLLSTNSSIAHEAPAVSADDLAPIPVYAHSDKPSGGAAARKAAAGFLTSLSDTQRAKIQMPLDDPLRASGWSNLPAVYLERPGLNLGELNADQRAHLFAFLSASLTPEGYERVGDIIAGEAYLSNDPDAELYQWAPKNYWLAFFGEISGQGRWAWQFGGHHLGLNVSIENDAVNSLSPSFVGTEPAVFTYKGVEYANVRDMHVAGFALYDVLSEKNKLRATLHSVPADVVTGPGKDGLEVPQVGVLGRHLTTDQRTQLLELIALWVKIQPDENAVQRMAELEEEIDQIGFAWAGSPKNNEEAYFRIQGPTLIIELKSDGNNVGQTAKGKGHYHTIYRNPKREYGQSD